MILDTDSMTIGWSTVYAEWKIITVIPLFLRPVRISSHTAIADADPWGALSIPGAELLTAFKLNIEDKDEHVQWVMGVAGLDKMAQFVCPWPNRLREVIPTTGRFPYTLGQTWPLSRLFGKELVAHILDPLKSTLELMAKSILEPVA